MAFGWDDEIDMGATAPAQNANVATPITENNVSLTDAEQRFLNRAFEYWKQGGKFNEEQLTVLNGRFNYSDAGSDVEFFKFYGYDVAVERGTAETTATTRTENKAENDLEIAQAVEPAKEPKPDNVLSYINNVMGTEIEQFKSIVNTGFTTLDKATGGLYNGLYVIAAISSLGKTTFSHQIADQIATAGKDVLYFSLEQSKLEMVSKSISRTAAKYGNGDYANGVSSLSIRKGYLPQHIKDAVVHYQEDVADRMSVVEGNFTTTIKTIKDKVKAYVDNNGVWPVVFIDYLQIIQPADAKEKRNGAKMIVDDIITELKRLSHYTPVWVICSVNRNNYLTPVDFEALKETGSIEYTADVVYGLQFQMLNNKDFDDAGIVEKREMIKKAKAASPRKIELVCLKNRYGIANFSMYYDYFPNVDLFIENEDDLDIEKKTAAKKTFKKNGGGK